MFKFIEKIDSKFTVRRKGFFALGAVILAAIWIVAGILFPLEWFSLFFDFTAGSYVTLALLSAVLSCIFTWIFSLITRQNISALLMFISNLIFQIGMFFLFAAFRYEMPYLWIITAAVHALVCVLIFLKSKPTAAPAVKRVKTEKKPLGTKAKIISAAAYSILSDAAYILLASLSAVWALSYMP
ncbi:MAG: hypothetical protein ACI4I1_09470 [Oscillospiraceae bacterium]